MGTHRDSLDLRIERDHATDSISIRSHDGCNHPPRTDQCTGRAVALATCVRGCQPSHSSCKTTSRPGACLVPNTRTAQVSNPRQLSEIFHRTTEADTGRYVERDSLFGREQHDADRPTACTQACTDDCTVSRNRRASLLAELSTCARCCRGTHSIWYRSAIHGEKVYSTDRFEARQKSHLVQHQRRDPFCSDAYQGILQGGFCGREIQEGLSRKHRNVQRGESLHQQVRHLDRVSDQCHTSRSFPLRSPHGLQWSNHIWVSHDHIGLVCADVQYDQCTRG